MSSPDPTGEAEELYVRVQGRVQGVSFRMAAQMRATELSLHGWVRNTEDNAVEACFQGERENLQQMLAWMRRGPAQARVTGAEVKWRLVGQAWSSFQIIQ